MSDMQKQQEQIRTTALEGLRRLSEGESAFRVASALYQNNVPGASPEEAEQHVARIAETVRSYEAGKAAAAMDAAGWIDAQLEPLLGGKNLPGRCAALAQVRAAMRAAGGAALPDRLYDYSAATEADEERLRAAFAGEAAASQLYGMLTAGMAEGFEACRMEEGSVEIAAREGGETAVKTVLAAALCAQAMDGEGREVAPEVSALCVSAGMDAVGCARGQMLGKMSPADAEKTKEIIGMVLTVLVVAALIYAGIVLLPQLPRLIPATLQPHTTWLGPALKHLGRFLPIYITLSYNAIHEACGNIANGIWELFGGNARVSAEGTLPLRRTRAETQRSSEEAYDEESAFAAADAAMETVSESELENA